MPIQSNGGSNISDEDRADEEVPYIAEPGVYFDGKYITPDDQPLCLVDDDEIHCLTCEFFVQSSCKLYNDPQAYEDLRNYLEILREQRLRTVLEQERRQARRSRIVTLSLRELSEHGLPLHYSKLGAIIRERYADLQASDSELYGAMFDNPALFKRIEPGIYTAISPEDE